MIKYKQLSLGNNAWPETCINHGNEKMIGNQIGSVLI